MTRCRPWRAFTVLVLLGLWPLAASSMLAQDAATDPSYLVAVYQGDCANPAVEASFRVGETYPYGAEPDDDDDDDDDLDLRGSANAEPVATIDETLDATFETLLEEQPHLIAVHQDAYEPEAIVACGELAGVVDDGRLVVAIRPIGGSGIAGIAIFDEDEEGFLGIGEDEVNVTAYLIDDLAAGDQGAPPAAPTPAEDELVAPTPTAPAGQPPTEATPPAGAATPTGGQTGQELPTEVTVEMVDIAFNPAEFTIPANTDVTITLPNNGATVHNFNIDANNNPSDPGIHSGDVQPGQSTTITINLPPGDWYYYCSIPGHEAAGMFGTVHVVEQ